MPRTITTEQLQRAKEYTLYKYEELSKEAKEKALQDHNSFNDYPFLQDDLREYIHEELTELGYTHGDITPLYSLSYSQGDGLMFEGSVTNKEGQTFYIEHKGHYYHERSTRITSEDDEGNALDVNDFEENVYIPLCKKIARRGYDTIEQMEGEDYFQETCDANGYTFLENGTMMNS